MIEVLRPPVPKLTRWHNAMGLLSLSITIGTGALLAWLVPPLRVSVLDVVFSGGGSSGSIGAIGAIIGLVMVVLILASLLRPGWLADAAMSEEIKYRSGAEDWSPVRRLWMVARFGMAHLFNLIVPVTIIIGLALSGALMMWVYLDAFRKAEPMPRFLRRCVALQQSAAVHVAHNRWVLRSVLVAIVVVTVAKIL